MVNDPAEPVSFRTTRIIYAAGLNEAERLYAMRLASKLTRLLTEEVANLPDEIRAKAFAAALAAVVDCLQNHPSVSAALQSFLDADEVDTTG